MPPAEGASPTITLRRRWPEFILPVGIVASVLVIMVPLPAELMDLLLAANITVAVIMLLTTIYVRTPLEFSIFPSLLLATTLGRLVLNVATTRLILTGAGDQGLNAAGGVIQGFGEFVAGNNIIVGLIIFIIIVVIQFVVITKGSTRISEVAARFALDGMPGRQMAIDADLQAGIIDEKQAQHRRLEITRQADFYGAMDGASKFVRGDAIAGIIITVINILGGLAIGMWQINPPMSLGQAGELFTKLTIGDGLVSQLPAFLISVAAGLLVTRSTEKTDLPREFLAQLFARPQALWVAVGFLGFLLFSGLPTVPLLMIGGGCAGLAVVLTKSERQTQRRQSREALAEQQTQAEPRVEEHLVVDPMEMEIGTNLIRLADPKRGGELLERIKNVREQVARGIGIVMPKVRIRDNHRLEKDHYRIKIADVPVADGSVIPGRLLALESPSTTGKVQGIETKEPAFGTPAVWIEPGQVSQAEMNAYTVVEPVSVLATHLQEVVRNHADEILTRDATKHLIDELREKSPAVVDELIPKPMTLAEVQFVLQMLLREGVPIRQLAAILETLGDFATRVGKDPILLAEQVRHRLSRTICDRYRDAEKRLRVVTLDPALEDRIRAGIEQSEGGIRIRMSAPAIKATCDLVAAEIEKLTRGGHSGVVLVNPQIRPGLKQMTSPHLPKLVVLSYNEITRDTIVESVGMIRDVP